MFGVLLESRARRQRRTGGMALSAAMHIVIIGVATAATVHGKPSKDSAPPVTFLRFTIAPTPPKAPARPSSTAPSGAAHVSAPTIPTLTISPPSIVPTSLPVVDLSRDADIEHFAIGPVAKGSPSGHPGRSLDLSDDSANQNEWRGQDLLMRIVASAKPRYPEVLRQGGIDGAVLLQFVVDTMGRVDMNSVRVLRSTHDLFTQAVRNSLSSFRFKPAELGGKRVPALAEMPFEFAIRR
jgi:protein TonB